MLVVQATLPLLQLTGTPARFAYYGWLATFPCMLFVAWLNRREPGMLILGIGLLLNLIVVAWNGGMPVFGDAVRIVNASPLPAIPAGDFVHVLGTAAAHLPWLADIIPLPGPNWLRVVASPGDLMLFAGIVAFVGMAGKSLPGRLPRDE